MPVKIILGIDPGTLFMGHGIIAVNGKSMELIAMSALKLNGKLDNYQRLQLIHDEVTALVRQYNPHELAIEAPFFGKNVQSMLKLGRAQGVAIAAAMSAGIPVTEYSPKKIKQSITGNGNANKEQVWRMLQTILFLKDKPRYFDATDALAVALCHHFQGKQAGMGIPMKPSAKKTGGWQQFIAMHPNRVIKG